MGCSSIAGAGTVRLPGRRVCRWRRDDEAGKGARGPAGARGGRTGLADTYTAGRPRWGSWVLSRCPIERGCQLIRRVARHVVRGTVERSGNDDFPSRSIGRLARPAARADGGGKRGRGACPRSRTPRSTSSSIDRSPSVSPGVAAYLQTTVLPPGQATHR
jgi:hypothetical protein